MENSPVRYRAANGITVAYRDAGSSGFPLILINRLASTVDMRNPGFLAALVRRSRTIIFDNRGTGYTSTDAAPFSIPLFAKDVVAPMDTLGISRAHILGLSMGASVAQEVALSRPERVDRLILVAGTCGGPQGIRMPPEVWDMLSGQGWGTHGDREPDVLRALPGKNWLASHDPWQYCPGVYETTSEANAARQAEAFFSWPGSWERLPGIRSPVPMTTGTGDVVIPPENAHILASRIPGARLVEVPGAGHGLQYPCPEAFTRAVLEFLPSGTG